METKYYDTYGAVRGSCGHRHRTIAAAWACLARDRRGCERASGYDDLHGGYSDRRVRVWSAPELGRYTLQDSEDDPRVLDGLSGLIFMSGSDDEAGADVRLPGAGVVA